MWHPRMQSIFELSRTAQERFERIWRHRALGWTLLAGFTSLFLYWRSNLPTVGKAIAALAVVAAIMATLRNISGVLEFAWVLLLFGFLFVEMRAIDEDKRKTTEELTHHFNDISNQAQQNMKDILKDENENFKSILTTQQQGFSGTIKQLIQDERQQNEKFSTILSKQQQLFEHEEQLAESLRGKLVPGSEATPDNNCGPLNGGILVMLGDEDQHNAAVVYRFPHTVLASQAFGPLVSLDKDGEYIFVLLDIRSRDGRIVARINRDGWVVNRNNFLEMKRDKSSLVVMDEFGVEVINVRYLNREAIAVKGRNIGFPPGMRYVCAKNAGQYEYLVP